VFGRFINSAPGSCDAYVDQDHSQQHVKEVVEKEEANIAICHAR
jgi:hypothetical protein